MVLGYNTSLHILFFSFNYIYDRDATYNVQRGAGAETAKSETLTGKYLSLVLQ